MVLFRLAKEEKNTKISTLPHTSPRIHLQSIAPRTAPGTVFRNNWVFLQSAHMSEHRSNQVFLFSLLMKNMKNRWPADSRYFRENLGLEAQKCTYRTNPTSLRAQLFHAQGWCSIIPTRTQKGGVLQGLTLNFSRAFLLYKWNIDEIQTEYEWNLGEIWVKSN